MLKRISFSLESANIKKNGMVESWNNGRTQIIRFIASHYSGIPLFHPINDL